MDENDVSGRLLTDRDPVCSFADIEPGQSVTGVAITAGGGGFTSAPTVTFTNDADDDTGAGAAGTATVVAGAVTAVTMTNSGSGFTAAPTVGFTGGGGTGATATATIARNRKIHVVSDQIESGTPRILLLGLDDSAQWVRTQDGGSWIDGEFVSIGSGGAQSATIWSRLVRVVKPATSSVVRLYSWDNTTSSIRRDLAAYEPSELTPVYRKSFVPGLQDMGGCSGAAGSCESKSVTILARLQHVPVSADNDFMVLGNLAALKLMAMAILREEENRHDEAAVLEGKAMMELEGELAAYQGDGVFVTAQVQDKMIWGAGVQNAI
jgi:hypothetical protein